MLIPLGRSVSKNKKSRAKSKKKTKPTKINKITFSPAKSPETAPLKINETSVEIEPTKNPFTAQVQLPRDSIMNMNFVKSNPSDPKSNQNQKQSLEFDPTKKTEERPNLNVDMNRFSMNLENLKVNEMSLKQMGEQFIRKGTSPGLEIMLDVLGILPNSEESSFAKATRLSSQLPPELLSSLIDKFQSAKNSLMTMQKISQASSNNSGSKAKDSAQQESANSDEHSTTLNNTLEKAIRDSYVGDRISFNLNKLILQKGDQKNMFFKRGTLISSSPKVDLTLNKKNEDQKGAIPEESMEVFEGGLDEEELKANNIFLFVEKVPKIT